MTRLTRRDALFVLIGVLAAAVVSLLLFVAVLARQGQVGRTVVVGRQATPTQVPNAVIERRIPAEFRFLAPLVPLQRGLSDAGRDAAGLLLVVVATGGALVLARDQVLRIRASSAGDAAEQARILGIGVGVLVAAGSVLVLAVFVLLRTVIAVLPQNIPFGLQTILSTLSLVVLLVGLAALLGFAATAWRVGAWLFGLEPWRAAGERVPAGLAALVAAALIYLLAQAPIVGPVIGVGVVAYSLGAFVRARLIRSEAPRTA